MTSQPQLVSAEEHQSPKRPKTASFCACIHRGAHQIGGSCIELACDGARILLDLGKPLDSEEADQELLPPVEGLTGGSSPSLLGIVISHGHIDHWGLAPLAHKNVRVVIGAATLRILEAAAPFVPHPFTPQDTIDLAEGTAVTLSPFTILPNLVDHSAFDAYALTVEAGGRRLFYSGDIRGHGRKAKLFERLLRYPPTSIDAMLMEGSSLGRLDDNEEFATETDIEEQFVRRFKMPGFITVSASAQNIDRNVSLYRACKRTGRTLLLDLYAMEVLKATGNEHLPRPGWPNLSVYIPEYQRRQIARTKRFDLLTPYKNARIYRERLAAIGEDVVMLFRPAMLPDIDLAGLWSGARAIWSQWDGYLCAGSGATLKADLLERRVPLEIIHTSGHASITDLGRLAKAISPKALVPIHTFEPERFSSLFENVVLRQDGEWWEV